MKLDPENQKVFEQLADTLIPAGAEMPSASQADVATWVETVLVARPDLAKPLRSLIEEAREQEPASFVEHLHQNDGNSFRILSEVVCGAYFMNPDVQQALGYHGQQQQPIDPRIDYMEDGLLESVIRRGPIYRPTPKTS